MNHMTDGFELIHDLVKHRWIPEIIGSIASGHENYSDILDDHKFLSRTELNRKLALLLEKNVVEKEVIENRSYYKLLEFGEDLDHIFKHFAEVGSKYI